MSLWTEIGNPCWILAAGDKAKSKDSKHGKAEGCWNIFYDLKTSFWAADLYLWGGWKRIKVSILDVALTSVTWDTVDYPLPLSSHKPSHSHPKQFLLLFSLFVDILLSYVAWQKRGKMLYPQSKNQLPEDYRI